MDRSERSVLSLSTVQLIQGCIADYACRHRLMDVLYEMTKVYPEGLSTLGVPHARLASAALYRLVSQNAIQDFPEALELAEILFHTLGSFHNPVMLRCYAKLLCGLKVKILFHQLMSSPRRAMNLLQNYFPSKGDDFDKSLHASNPQLSAEIQKAVKDFRKSFLPLINDETKRRHFLRNEYESLYGDLFSRCLAQRTVYFLKELEADLPPTYIDELMDGPSDSVLQSLSTSSCDATRMLVECVGGKKASIVTSLQLIQLVKNLARYNARRPSVDQDALDVGDCLMEVVEDPDVPLPGRKAPPPSPELQVESGQDLQTHHSNEEEIETCTQESAVVRPCSVELNVLQKEQDLQTHHSNQEEIQTLARGSAVMRPCSVELNVLQKGEDLQTQHSDKGVKSLPRRSAVVRPCSVALVLQKNAPANCAFSLDSRWKLYS